MTRAAEAPKRHAHRFRTASSTLDSVVERCRCGAERARAATPQEKKNHLDALRKAETVHRTWTAFAARFIDPRTGRFRAKGSDLIAQIELYARRRTEITALPCDDDHHAGSILVLIRHRSRDDYHGVTVLFVPQCTGEEPVRMFLYPCDARPLLEAMRTEWRIAKSYPEVRSDVRRDARVSRKIRTAAHRRHTR